MPIKSQHANLLNELDRLQHTIYYYGIRCTLMNAEQAIVQLEAERDSLRAQLGAAAPKPVGPSNDFVR